MSFSLKLIYKEFILKFNLFKQKIVFVILSYLFADALNAAEILLNGGFEEGTTSWTWTTFGVGGRDASSAGRSGIKGFWAFNTTDPGGTLRQTLTTGETTSVLSFLIKTNF